MAYMQGWPRRLMALGLVLLLAALAWRFGPWGRAPAMVRIGLVPFTAVNDRVIEGFKQGLAERGWEEGRNVTFRSLPADGQIAPLEGRLSELLAWKPHLVLAMSTPTSQAAYRATRASATPLVFAPVSDPLAAGIVTSLAHPGEHATGVRLLPSNGLRLEALARMVPQARSYYVPYSQADKSALATLAQIEPAARALGIRLLLQPVDELADIERAAQQIPAQADAVFLPQDSRIEGMIELFVASARARRLPLSAPSALQVEQGALMTFGFDHRAIGRQAARLADDILRGTPPGKLPVETAENGLHINLRTAREIGLVVDDAMTRQAQVLLR
jgi:putative ABC transport system substrate-binding protein